MYLLLSVRIEARPNQRQPWTQARTHRVHRALSAVHTHPRPMLANQRRPPRLSRPSTRVARTRLTHPLARVCIRASRRPAAVATCRARHTRPAVAATMVVVTRKTNLVGRPFPHRRLDQTSHTSNSLHSRRRHNSSNSNKTLPGSQYLPVLGRAFRAACRPTSIWA